MTQTVLVTGASRGIGAALVQALAAREGTIVHALARPSATLDALCARTGAVPVGVNLMDTAAVEAALTGHVYDTVINIVKKNAELAFAKLKAVPGLMPVMPQVKIPRLKSKTFLCL